MLVSPSYEEHGNVATVPKHGNSHVSSQGKELDRKTSPSLLHKPRLSANRNGWHTLRDLVAKVAAPQGTARLVLSLTHFIEAENVTALALSNARHTHTKNTSKLARVSRSLCVKKKRQSRFSRERVLLTQLWYLVIHSWKRKYAKDSGHRRRREQAIAQHRVLREEVQGSQEESHVDTLRLHQCLRSRCPRMVDDPASLADVVREEVQNLTAREHFCQ